MVKVLHWNGKDLPAELKELPAGEYTIVPKEYELTPEEDAAVQEALDEYERTGESFDGEQVHRELRALPNGAR